MAFRVIAGCSYYRARPAVVPVGTLLQRCQQRLLQRGEGCRVGERAVGGVGEVEAVFGFFAEGADFGVADVHAVRKQDAAHQREQAVPVFAGEFEGGVRRFLLDVDAGADGEVFVAAAGQAAGERRRRAVVGDVCLEFAREFGRGWRCFAEGVFLDGEAVVARGVEARFVDVVVVFFEVVGDARQQDVRRVGAADDEARRVLLDEACGVWFAACQGRFVVCLGRGRWRGWFAGRPPPPPPPPGRRRRNGRGTGGPARSPPTPCPSSPRRRGRRPRRGRAGPRR